LEHRRRSEQAIVAVVMEAYVNGVSTRKVDRLVEQLGVEGMTKDRVSAMRRHAHASPSAIRRRVQNEFSPGRLAVCRRASRPISLRLRTRLATIDAGNVGCARSAHRQPVPASRIAWQERLPEDGAALATVVDVRPAPPPQLTVPADQRTALVPEPAADAYLGNDVKARVAADRRGLINERTHERASSDER
jgi:Transposase, Mutator family